MKPVAPRLGILLILLAAFGLRTWRLDFQELRGDEVFGYFFSLRSLADLAPATIALKEPHPIGSYVLQHGWLGWAGHSEFALRFVTVWFGVAAVALLFRLARSLDFTPIAAVTAAFLLAISPYAVWHSQDARMYTMSLALTIASSWLGMAWLCRPRRRWAVGYILISWLALHIHYFALFIFLAQLFFVIAYTITQPNGRFLLRDCVIGQTFVALLYLPWYLQVSEIVRTYGGNGDSPALADMLWRSFSVFAVGESVPLSQRLWWALLAGLVVLAGGWRLWNSHIAESLDADRNGLGGSALMSLKKISADPPNLLDPGPKLNARSALWFLALYLFFPLLATWWSSRQRPIFNERYLIAAAPPFYLLAGALFHVITTAPKPDRSAAPLQVWRGRFLSALLLFALLFTGMGLSLQRHYTDPVYSKTRGWRDLAVVMQEFAAGLSPEQARIAQNFPDPTLWYYYRGPLEHLVLPPGPYDAQNAQVDVAQLAADGIQRVILPLQPAPNWDDQGIAAAALTTHYGLLTEKPVGVWPVQVYTRKLAAAEIELGLPDLPGNSELPGRFANGLFLTASSVQPATLSAGSVLAVYLTWRRAEEPIVTTGEELKVFVQLLNPNGQLVSQQDRTLDSQMLTASTAQVEVYGLLLPDALPAGVYRLIAGLYQPALAGAPRVLLASGADFVTLMEIEVSVD